MRTGDEFQGPTCPRCDELCWPDETRCPMCGSLLTLVGTLLDAVGAPDLPTPPQAVRLPAACVTSDESIQQSGE